MVMKKPAKGQETAQAVLDKIRMHPEIHDQSSWCGTTQCVGGWAVHLHGGFDLNYTYFDQARMMLDLDSRDAMNLFYGTDNEQALHALEFLAKGQAIDWDAVIGKDRCLAAPSGY